jgi:hypothetical protein
MNPGSSNTPSPDDDYDLTSIGCGELIIPNLLRTQDFSGIIPDYYSLKTLQPPKKTPEGTEYYTPHSLFVNRSEVYIPVLEKFEKMNGGGYGTIYSGRRSVYIPDLSSEDEKRKTEGIISFKRASEFQEICIKSVPIALSDKEARTTPQTRAYHAFDKIQELVNETVIHGLIQNALERAGFQTSVPELYEIVALTHDGSVKHLTNTMDVKEIWITMEILKGSILNRYLRRKLVRIPSKFTRTPYQLLKEKENEQLILDVCFQMSCYLDILQEKLRFNHRDMKIDNAFCRYHPRNDKWVRNIRIPDIGTWKCKHDFVLIDFGSGCISCTSGCEEYGSSLIASNVWFESSACMKYGRDMAQFIYEIHAEFPLKEYISHELFDVLDSATIAVESDATSMDPVKSFHLFAGVDPDGKPSPIRKCAPMPDTVLFNKGIYTFLKQDNVDVPGCRPKTLLQTLGRYAAVHYKDSFISESSGWWSGWLRRAGASTSPGTDEKI